MTDELARLLNEPALDIRRIGAVLAAGRDSAEPEEGGYFGLLKKHVREPSAAARLAALDPVVTEAALRKGAGLECVPGSADFRAWLTQSAGSWRSLLDPAVDPSRLTVLDLGSEDSEIANASAAQDRQKAQTLYDALMRETGNSVAIGRWLEKRTIYSTDNYISAFDSAARRNLHLGLDVFVPAGTTLLLPLAGKIVQTMIMDDRLDYGGVVVLEHQWRAGESFWSIWGHLTHETTRRWKIGDAVAAGTPFATVGDFEENGWWVPHLHLQFLRCPYDDYARAPGVGEEMFADIWRDLSPDPTVLVIG